MGLEPTTRTACTCVYMYMYIILCKGSETSFVCTCCLTLSSGETLAQAREWLKQLPTNAMETVDCGGQSLDQPQIAAVEKAVLDMKVCIHVYTPTCTCIYNVHVQPYSHL